MKRPESITGSTTSGSRRTSSSRSTRSSSLSESQLAVLEARKKAAELEGLRLLHEEERKETEARQRKERIRLETEHKIANLTVDTLLEQDLTGTPGHGLTADIRNDKDVSDNTNSIDRTNEWVTASTSYGTPEGQEKHDDYFFHETTDYDTNVHPTGDRTT